MTQAIGLHDKIRIGQVIVNPIAGEVLSDSGMESLHPHAAELLVALANRPGEVIDRAALISEVWGAGHASDQALTHCVSELRHVLGDHSDRPRFIQTIPRRGYRLVAPVERLGPEVCKGENRSDDASDDDNGPESAHGNRTGANGSDDEKRGLLAELSRRRVARVAITYAVIAWVTTEVVSTIFPIMSLPDWTVTLVVVSLAIGFPLAAALAWAFDINEGGIERSPTGPAAVSPLQFVLRLVVRGLLLTTATAALVAVLVPGLGRYLVSSVSAFEFGVEPAALALVPFEPVPDKPGVATLAAAVSDEIAVHLSAISGLDVTVLPFDANHVPAENLAGEAPVLMSGTVSEMVDNVVVTARLIETQSGVELWSRTFVADAQRNRDGQIVADAAKSLACGIASGAAIPDRNTG